jgi:hypothetical protein
MNSYMMTTSFKASTATRKYEVVMLFKDKLMFYKLRARAGSHTQLTKKKRKRI